jgi:serine phosphatase RsbU (regulator of sigma subunit)
MISRLKKIVWTNAHAFLFVGIFFFDKCPPINLKIDEDFFVNTLKRKKGSKLILYLV